MKEKGRVVLVLAVVLLAGAALWATLSWAAPGGLLAPPEVIPPVVAYQGEVQVSGNPYTGHGYFKFAVVDGAGATSYWSNDGSSGDGGEPAEAVPLEVSEGLFSVLLGDTTLEGMAEPLGAEVFGEPEGHLRVWFSPSEGGPFEQLAPDTQIAAVPYALRAQEAANADTVDGLHASQLGADYKNVVVVAKSGGDYASVQAAMDGIGDAATDNAYLVWVAPGVYDEQVTMKPHVHLQGAGQEATVITSAASSGSVPSEGTLVLASDTSVRDLTLENSGAGDFNVALLANAGVTGTLVADVTARAQGGGANNYAVFVMSAGTEVTLQQVTALAENGFQYNYGLANDLGALATLHGGSFTGRGGTSAYGIFNTGGDTMLEAEGVTALGENGSSANYGLDNRTGAAAVLRGGSLTGRGGTYGRGIGSSGGGTTLVAEYVTALGEGGSAECYGLWNNQASAATLRGGSFTGRGGGSAAGIQSLGGGTLLEAYGITALGENGSSANYGLDNRTGAAAVLRGGSFAGRGGNYGRGIGSYSSGTTLLAEYVTALGEGGTDQSYGLNNGDGSAATLRGGSFTGLGAEYARGVSNDGSGTTLVAEGIAALGEGGTRFSDGLSNVGEATLRGGSFTGRGGPAASGIENLGSGSTLEAEGASVLGEGGSTSNTGLSSTGDWARATQSVLAGQGASVLASGSVTISNSRLVGGAVSGAATCVLVTRDGTVSTDGSTCP